MIRNIQLCAPCEKLRVAVIEIGSKSVRLRISDIKGADVSYVDSSSQFIMPGAVIGKSHEVVRQKLEEIADAIESFQVSAKANQADVISVVGTEALRNLLDTERELCKDIIPDARALDGCSEAICGLISAAKTFPSVLTSGKNILLIDQGSGSIQIANGHMRDDDRLTVNYSDSFPLGANVLFEMLRHVGGNILGRELLAFDNQLEEKLLRYDAKAEDFKEAITIVTGSTATKAVWLREKLLLIEEESLNRGRQSESVVDKNYDKSKVHGKTYRVREIEKNVEIYLKLLRRDEKMTRHFFSPENPNGTTFEEVILSLMCLRKILEPRKVSSFLVSTEGTNIGISWALALGGEGFLTYYD